MSKNNTKAKESAISEKSEVKTESVKTTAQAAKPQTPTEERVNISMKDTKENMLKFIKAVAIITGNQSDKNSRNLGERLVYALEHAAKSTKAEIFDMVKEAQDYLNALNAKAKPAAVETEKKPVKKPTLVKKDGKPTAPAPKTEPEKPAPKKTEAKKPTAKKPEKTTPKTTPKTEEKESAVKSTKNNKFGKLPTAIMFPEEIEVQDLGKLRIAPDTFTSMEDVAKAFESGKRIFFVAYWNEAQIKQFQYQAAYACLSVKSFKDDLDILEPVFYGDRTKKMWCNSLYTEGMFTFYDDEVKHIVSKNPYNGEDFRVRVSNGMEFEIYELIEETEAE